MLHRRPMDAELHLSRPRGTAFTFVAPAGFDIPRDSRASQTPWSVFQDGSDGLPTDSSLTSSVETGVAPEPSAARAGDTATALYTRGRAPQRRAPAPCG